MSIVDGNWKVFMARATVLSAMLGIVVFGAVRLASARDGVPGSARTWVTFAGVVSGLPGDPRTANMRFSFHRASAGADAGVPPTLCAPMVRDISLSPTGAFSAQIPLDDPSSVCPSDLFDGRDVQIDIDVGAETLVRNAPVNPVPYAHFATNAGIAGRLVRGPRFRQSGPGPGFVYDERDAGAGDPVVPGLSVTLPTSGTYLIVFTARCFASGRAQSSTRDDQNAVDLIVGSRRIVRRALPGYLGENTSQRVNNIAIVTTYTASAGDVVRVRLHVLTGRAELSSTEDDDSRLIAIPMEEEL